MPTCPECTQTSGSAKQGVQETRRPHKLATLDRCVPLHKMSEVDLLPTVRRRRWPAAVVETLLQAMREAR